MGLAASQARVALITSRQNDVEAQLLTIAHQKLAISRKSAEISRNYTKALNTTTEKTSWTLGTTTTDDLLYSDIMAPNSSNIGTQYSVVDSSGRAVLNSRYANILGGGDSGTAASVTMTQTAFLAAAMGISTTDADGYVNTYNNTTPAPSSTASFTTSYKDSKIMDYLENSSGFINEEEGSTVLFNGDMDEAQVIMCEHGEVDDSLINAENTVANIEAKVIDALKANVSMDSAKFKEAADYAKVMTMSRYNHCTENWETQGTAIGSATGCNFITRSWENDKFWLDVNQVIKTFLNYFDAACAELASGGSLTKKADGSSYNALTSDVGKAIEKYVGTASSTRTTGGTADDFETAGSSALITTPAAVSKSTDATYYLNLFKLIQAKGWVKDTSMDANSGTTLQNKLKNGYYLSLYSGGSWSGNISSSKISTVTEEDDDDAIEKAKAEYEASKDKLDYKESMLDLQQNDLDTERSALVTEMESVKAILNKNIEKFKLFQNG